MVCHVLQMFSTIRATMFPTFRHFESFRIDDNYKIPVYVPAGVRVRIFKPRALSQYPQEEVPSDEYPTDEDDFGELRANLVCSEGIDVS